jgi:hypothetical protein
MCIHCRGNIFTESLSSNNRGYTYRHTGLWEGFMKYAFEMDSDAMMYIPSFIKIGSGIPKSKGGYTDTRTVWWSYFHFFKIWEVGWKNRWIHNSFVNANSGKTKDCQKTPRVITKKKKGVIWKDREYWGVRTAFSLTVKWWILWENNVYRTNIWIFPLLT